MARGGIGEFPVWWRCIFLKSAYYYYLLTVNK
jgi:hypothetical protein